MKFRTCVSIVILTAWTLIRVLSPAGADIVSCNCADACCCPDDDTSDTTQVTWCNGTTQMTCTCAGSGCPTGTRETCVAQTVCSGAAGPYEPCGGKGQDTCECGGGGVPERIGADLRAKGSVQRGWASLQAVRREGEQVLRMWWKWLSNAGNGVL